MRSAILLLLAAFASTSGFAANTPVPQFQGDTVGIYRPTTGEWFLDKPGLGLDIHVRFGGQPGDLPVAGDWNADGRTDIGIFRNGTMHLALLRTDLGLTTAVPFDTFEFGLPGDLPVAGDWNGDGRDDVGVFRGSIGRFILRQTLFSNGLTFFTSFNVTFGAAGDLPVVGDWNGNGHETPGVLRIEETGNGFILLTNSFFGGVDHNILFGAEGALPVAGDWKATGVDGIGFFNGAAQAFVLLANVTDDPKTSLLVVQFGQPGDLPVSGKWVP